MDTALRQIHNRFDELIDFLAENMVTKKELKDELAKLVTKDELDQKLNILREKLVTKDELDERFKNVATKEDIAILINTVDAYMKETKTFNDEKLILQDNQKRVEDWVKKAAPTVGIPYEI
jgi:hypothetical protein